MHKPSSKHNIINFKLRRSKKLLIFTGLPWHQTNLYIVTINASLSICNTLKKRKAIGFEILQAPWTNLPLKSLEPASLWLALKDNRNSTIEKWFCRFGVWKFYRPYSCIIYNPRGTLTPSQISLNEIPNKAHTMILKNTNSGTNLTNRTPAKTAIEAGTII